MTKLKLFTLVITLAVLLGLSGQWSESASPDARAVVQSPMSNVQSQDDNGSAGQSASLQSGDLVRERSKPQVPVDNGPVDNVGDKVPGDIHDEIQEGARLTRATISVRFTEADYRFRDADYTRHVNELKARIKKKLSSDQFSIVVQKPFVVVGDEPASAVQQRAEETVKWAVDRLRQDFFTKDPEDILDIWLFKDEASYEKHTQLLFGDKPTTPYGYYSSTHKALIMNIATGGGTLVHEIVHPFMEANFPACPPWLNEGLGSLYEQCGEEDGHIHGFTNWRLPGLQRAIREKRVPSFKTLTAMNTSAFYNDDRGTNYAQSRYLCYYLQEKGVLVKFYQEFVARQKEDPSGFKSLQRVLAEPDMDAFKSKWEKYVMGLRQE